MLINLRNALMTGKRLPYDAEVEYLESTGTQWIDTGVLGNQHIVSEFSFAMTNTNAAYATIFGSRKGWMNQAFSFWRDTRSSGSAAFSVGNAGNSTAYSLANKLWHRMRLGRRWKFDEYSGDFGQGVGSFTTPTTLTLFGFNWTGGAGVQNAASMKCGYLRIYSDNILVRDYIPVRKGTVGYLYDRVSGKLFGNAGTGDFVLGNDLKYPIPA